MIDSGVSGGPSEGSELVKVRALGPGKSGFKSQLLFILDVRSWIKYYYFWISVLYQWSMYVRVLELRDSFIHSVRWFGLAHSWKRSFNEVSYYFVDNFFPVNHTEFGELDKVPRSSKTHSILRMAPPIQSQKLTQALSPFILKHVPPLHNSSG